MKFSFKNQLSKKLINVLGTGVFWYNPIQNWNKFSVLGVLFLNFIEIIMKIFFKSGLITTHNLYFHKFFFKSSELLSFPVYITKYTFPKFYRFLRLKYSLGANRKKTILTRKTFILLNLTELRLYRKNNKLIFFLFVTLPNPFKRQIFLETSKKRNHFNHFNFKLVIKNLIFNSLIFNFIQIRNNLINI